MLLLSSSFLAPLAPLTLYVPYWALVFCFALAAFYTWVSYWPGRNVKLRPIRASKFAPHLVPQNLDTIVIGSGSGGSSCSNILAQSGQRVLLLEQHEDRTGGCTHTFRIEGCEWDTGLHYTSEGMGLSTHRAGALLKFMTRGKQEWQRYVYDLFLYTNCDLFSYVTHAISPISPRHRFKHTTKFACARAGWTILTTKSIFLQMTTLLEANRIGIVMSSTLVRIMSWIPSLSELIQATKS